MSTFTSQRAAAADLSGQAARAFGWPGEWAGQLDRAREQFQALPTEIPPRGQSGQVAVPGFVRATVRSFS